MTGSSEEFKLTLGTDPVCPIPVELHVHPALKRQIQNKQWYPHDSEKQHLYDVSAVILRDHLQVHLCLKLKTECKLRGIILFHKLKLKSVFKIEIHDFPLLIVF